MPDLPAQAPVVDLTQPLSPQTVLWPGSVAVECDVVTSIEADGSFARTLLTPEHAGTHFDAPAHFVAGGQTADLVPAGRLVAPCAVIDVRDASRDDPDYTLESPAVTDDERRHGRLEPGMAVLLATGWDRFAAEPDRYLGGADAQSLHFPGFGSSAAELLVERGVVGLGIDTVSVDAGRDTEFPVHNRTLPAGLWHLEGLVNLDRLPPRGATLFVGALKLEAGSGAPARVLALLP